MLPLRMSVSSGVVGGTLRRILAVPESPSSVETHVTLTVLLLPVVSPQEQGPREVDEGQRQTAVVRSVKAVASASPQTPPWMNGK